MSEHVELTRRFIEVFNARDIEALVAYADPSIEFHSLFAAVGGAVYHGHDGLRRWHRDLEEAWGVEVRLEIETYFDLGEHILTFFVYPARGPRVDGTVGQRWRCPRPLCGGGATVSSSSSRCMSTEGTR